MAVTSALAFQLAANREKILRFAFILQFIAAIPFLWFACVTGKTQASLLYGSKTAPGTVVAVFPVRLYRTSSSGAQYSRGTVYDVIVEYAPAGEPVRFQDRRTTRVAASVGSPVQVIYNPTHPLTAMVDRGYINYLPWGPPAAIGSFLILVALKGLISLFLQLFRA